jgi:hypothetical protein
MIESQGVLDQFIKVLRSATIMTTKLQRVSAHDAESVSKRLP